MALRVSPTVLERYRSAGRPYPYQDAHEASAHLYPRITRANALDDKPRAAPAHPKPLEFPHYQVQGDLDAVHNYVHDFSRLFVDLEKNVSPEHLEALNVSLLGEVPLDRLVPGEYLPPQEWLQFPPSVTEPSNISQQPGKLSNGSPIPAHKDFHQRAQELLLSTDAAFDTLAGPRAGKLRLAYSHRFYQHLLLMAEFWDTSKDNYTTTENDKEMYTGRRYGAGHDMPPAYRDDAICAFVEMCIWPFRCVIQHPRSAVARRLEFQDRYLPIQGVTSAVCRNTTDRQKARRGVLEGPLMGIHCRNTTAFRAAKTSRDGPTQVVAGQKGQGREELLDLLFEVGAALLVAQKRARQGETEVQPGKDQFWANGNKRHLGELGGGTQDRETNARARREMEEGSMMQGGGKEEVEEEAEEGLDEKGNGSRKRKQRPGALQAYLDAKPAESMWEGKVEYRMIGKDVGVGVDHIYLISSLNHHLSLVNISVDDRYLDFITRGPAHPGFDPSQQEWWILEVKRSRWYDLFEPEDRVEAMRGVWGAVGWMMREAEKAEEGE